MCARRLSDWLNFASQILHSYTFTPFSCVFMWYLEFLAIILKQIGHSSVSSSWPNMPLEVLWLFMCTFRFILRLNACSQISHLNLRSDGLRLARSSGLWTIFMCLPRVDDAVNALLQISHLYRFSPVWISIWPCRLDELANFFSEISKWSVLVTRVQLIEHLDKYRRLYTYKEFVHCECSCEHVNISLPQKLQHKREW